jgi:hypothetical protein
LEEESQRSAPQPIKGSSSTKNGESGGGKGETTLKSHSTAAGSPRTRAPSSVFHRRAAASPAPPSPSQAAVAAAAAAAKDRSEQTDKSAGVGATSRKVPEDVRYTGGIGSQGKLSTLSHQPSPAPFNP